MAETDGNNRSTLDAYRNLLQVEVKSLLNRVSSITETQDQLLGNVNDLALQLEEVVATMERLEQSRSYFRQEIEDLKQATQRNEDYSKVIFRKFQDLQQKLAILTKKLGVDLP